MDSTSREMMVTATTTLSVHHIFSVLFTGITDIFILIVYVKKLSFQEVKWLPKLQQLVRGSIGIQSVFSDPKAQIFHSAKCFS